MEWSCLDWNTPSIHFYNKIGAVQEKGRKNFAIYNKLVDCLEKCLIYGHIRRFAD